MEFQDRPRLDVDGIVVTRISGWLFMGKEMTIKTGDTIVVPVNTEATPTLSLRP
jgi:hypothetical protein